MAAYKAYNRTGIRHLGNSDPSHMEVHDLLKETANCQINEIFRAGHAAYFMPDTLDEAHRCGYDNCAYCIGGSKR